MRRWLFSTGVIIGALYLILLALGAFYAQHIPRLGSIQFTESTAPRGETVQCQAALAKIRLASHAVPYLTEENDRGLRHMVESFDPEQCQLQGRLNIRPNPQNSQNPWWNPHDYGSAPETRQRIITEYKQLKTRLDELPPPSGFKRWIGLAEPFEPRGPGLIWDVAVKYMAQDTSLPRFLQCGYPLSNRLHELIFVAQGYMSTDDDSAAGKDFLAAYWTRATTCDSQNAARFTDMFDLAF